jgi:septum formation topological specificity factor MinE
MRTENQSSRIVDQAETETRPGFRPQDIIASSRPLWLKPVKVDKLRAEIKKTLKRYESIVSELKILLDMKPKDRKIISGLITKWLKTLE